MSPGKCLFDLDYDYDLDYDLDYDYDYDLDLDYGLMGVGNDLINVLRFTYIKKLTKNVERERDLQSHPGGVCG